MQSRSIRSTLTSILVAGLTLLFAGTVAADTTITYQGQLQDGSGPYTGTPDMVFRLYDSLTGANQVGADIEIVGVPVTDGLFQAELDFGDAYDGGRWLEIEVDGAVLAPRQPISSVPVAIRAHNVSDSGSQDGWLLGGNAGTDPASDFLGTNDSTPFEIHVDGQRAWRVEPADVPNLIGGWSGNTVGAGVRGATISGGGCADLAVFPCQLERPNEVTADFATIGGGLGNTASSPWATVGGGEINTASASNATVGGGLSNIASGARATVGGGAGNTAMGQQSTVPGGLGNKAAGDYSLAAGRRAKAQHNGAFVWADSTSADFASTGQDQFLIRAGGGVGVNTNEPLRDGLHVKQQSGSPSQIGLVLERGGSSTSNWAFYVAGSDNLGFRFNDNLVARINSSDGEFVALSDARRKDDIEPFSGALEQVLQLQPSTYFMTTDGDRKHRSIGLIAQEVMEVLPSAVSQVEDVYGVSYNQITVLNTAAIIELNARLHQALDAHDAGTQQLRTQVTELQAQLKDSRSELARERSQASDLDARLAALEALLLEDRSVVEVR